MVSLKNPKGGAEIGFGGQVTVVIPTNDDAHGVIGFAQVSRKVFGYQAVLCNHFILSYLGPCTIHF